jgi:WD40 repeat protein
LSGVAAALLIGGNLLLSGRFRPEPPPVIAQIEEAQGSVFVIGQGGRQPAQAGRPLVPHEELLTFGEESSAVVVYPDGTRLSLGPNTTVSQFVASPAEGASGDVLDKRVSLDRGVMTAEVAPQPVGHPMVVVTPNAKVVALGTRFVVESEPDTTTIEVTQGAVRFTRNLDNQSIEVGQGNFAVAAPAVERLAPQPLAGPAAGATAGINVARGARLGHKGGWSSVAFTADGLWLAGCMWSDGIVRLWRLTELHAEGPVLLAGHTGALWSVALSPDGRSLASGGVDRTARLWDVPGGQPRATVAHKDHVRAVAFSPDGKTLATGSFESRIRLCDVPTGKESAVFRENDRGGWAGVYALAFSADGRWLASGLSDRRVRVRELATGREHFVVTGHSDAVRSVAFAPQGNVLATASNNEVVVWDAQTGAERHRLAGSAAVAFSPDGKLIAVGGLTPGLWDAATGRIHARLQGHRGEVYSLAFSPDGKLLALGGWLGITLLPLSSGD